MATYIMLRRNVPEDIAPREAEPVMQQVGDEWVLKVGDGSTPVQHLPVVAGPGAYNVVEGLLEQTTDLVQRAEQAAAQIGAGSVTFSLDPENPALIIATFPAFMLADDGHSIVVPVEVTP